MKMLEGRQMLGKHGLLRSTSKKSNCRCSTSSAQVSHGLGQHLGALTSLDSQGDLASAVQGKETEEHSNRRADGGRWQRDPRAGLQERPGCSGMQGVGVEEIGFPEDRVLGLTSQGGRRNGLGTELGTKGCVRGWESGQKRLEQVLYQRAMFCTIILSLSFPCHHLSQSVAEQRFEPGSV